MSIYFSDHIKRVSVPLFNTGTVFFIYDKDEFNNTVNSINEKKNRSLLAKNEAGKCYVYDDGNKIYYVVGIFDNLLLTFVNQIAQITFSILNDIDIITSSKNKNDRILYCYMLDYLFDYFYIDFKENL